MEQRRNAAVRVLRLQAALTGLAVQGEAPTSQRILVLRDVDVAHEQGRIRSDVEVGDVACHAAVVADGNLHPVAGPQHRNARALAALLAFCLLRRRWHARLRTWECAGFI